MELSLEKIQSMYNDELQVLRKKLESKDKTIRKLLETIKNISNNAVQPNPLPMPIHSENDSNDTDECEKRSK